MRQLLSGDIPWELLPCKALELLLKDKMRVDGRENSGPSLDWHKNIHDAVISNIFRYWFEHGAEKFGNRSIEVTPLPREKPSVLWTLSSASKPSRIYLSMRMLAVGLDHSVSRKTRGGRWARAYGNSVRWTLNGILIADSFRQLRMVILR